MDTVILNYGNHNEKTQIWMGTYYEKTSLNHNYCKTFHIILSLGLEYSNLISIFCNIKIRYTGKLIDILSIIGEKKLKMIKQKQVNH